MAVYFYGCVSLVGYLATKEHDLSWLYDTGTTADTGYEAFYEQMDMTLMGCRTFDEVATLAVPAEAYPTTDNVVFTHQSLDCEGFRAVCADPVTFVKAQDGAKNIWVVGAIPSLHRFLTPIWWMCSSFNWHRCFWVRGFLSLLKRKPCTAFVWKGCSNTAPLRSWNIIEYKKRTVRVGSPFCCAT